MTSLEKAKNIAKILDKKKAIDIIGIEKGPHVSGSVRNRMLPLIRPQSRSKALIGLRSVCRSHIQMAEATTGGTNHGEKIRVRTTARPRNLAFTTCARNRPIVTTIAIARIVKITV